MRQDVVLKKLSMQVKKKQFQNQYILIYFS